MSNIHKKPVYRFITALFLMLGIAVTGLSTQRMLSAKVYPGQTYIAAEHFAATAQEDDMSALIVGMLLVLAGFSFHALYVVRQREPVHVKMGRSKHSWKKKYKRKA